MNLEVGHMRLEYLSPDSKPSLKAQGSFIFHASVQTVPSAWNNIKGIKNFLTAMFSIKEWGDELLLDGEG